MLVALCTAHVLRSIVSCYNRKMFSGPAMTQVLVLFAVLALGFAAAKFRVIGEEGIDAFISLILKLTLPCLIVDSMQREFDTALLSSSATILVVSLAMYAVCFALAWPATKALRTPRETEGVYRFALVFSNVGFMGLPVLNATLGPQAVFFGSIYNIPFNLLAFSVGIKMISHTRGEKMRLGDFLSIPFVATVLGFVLFVARLKLPAAVGSAIALGGSITTPLSMIAIGAMLARSGFGVAFRDWRLYAVSALRLFVLPALLLVCLWALGLRGLILGVPVVIAAMPAAANTPILARAYGGAEHHAAALVSVSTFGSVLSIPLFTGLVS